MLLHNRLLWMGSVLLASLGPTSLVGWAQEGLPPAPLGETPPVVTQPSGLSEPAGSAMVPAQPALESSVYDPECEPRTSRYQQWKEQHRAKWRDKMWGYPEEFVRPPVGAVVQHYRDQQKLNGRLTRMALYEYDFVPGTAELKPRGRDHLARIAEWIPQTPGDISIEPSREGTELDEARRQAVFEELATLPCGIALVNIRTARRRHPGLDAPTGLLINQNRLQQTRVRGINSAGASGSSMSDTSGGGSGATAGPGATLP
jgi:hypothetical protein